MTVGVYSFEIHIHDSRSLKDRRQIVRRVKDRLRARHNVAVVESGEHAELWQRAGLIVVSIAARRSVLTDLFEAVHREAESCVPGQVVETGSEFLELFESGASGWTDEESEEEQ